MVVMDSGLAASRRPGMTADVIARHQYTLAFGGMYCTSLVMV
jgi:hypothetical protein